MLAGSLPPGVPVSIYEELTADLSRRGIRVAVDTSDRPLQFAIAAKPSVIKPNIHELEAITGRSLKSQADVLATARELVQGGIECVIVSMGVEGALFVTASEALLPCRRRSSSAPPWARETPWSPGGSPPACAVSRWNGPPASPPPFPSPPST